MRWVYVLSPVCIEKYFLKGFIFGLTSSFSQVRICSTILCNIRNSNPCKKCILTMTVLLYGKVNQIWLKIGNIWATTYLPTYFFIKLNALSTPQISIFEVSDLVLNHSIVGLFSSKPKKGFQNFLNFHNFFSIFHYT